MSVFPITRNKHLSFSPQPQALKPGQIVQGTINKIYPNQHAQVKLGNQVVHAQLEAPLQVGESYYFQVESIGENIYLTVIQTNHAKHAETSIHQLMNHLQLSHHDTIAHFLQSLIRQHIPFSAQQIKSAVAFLTGAENKEVAQQLLRSMIGLHLPMTQDVFDALYTTTTQKFSDQLTYLLQHVNNEEGTQSVLRQQIINTIESLLHRELNSRQAFVNQILYDVSNNDQRLFHVFKSLGILGQVQYATWASTWETFSHDYFSNPARLIEQLPFQLDIDQSLSTMLHMKEQQQALTQAAKNILQRWANTLMNDSLTAHEFTMFKNDLHQQIGPYIPDDKGPTLIRTMQHNNTQVHHMLTILETLVDEQTYQKIAEVLLITQSERTAMMEPKDIFLNQLKRVLLFTGISDENYLINDQPSQITASLKHMLLQYIEQNDAQMSERLQPFIHLLNGLQLQSIYETYHFISASLVIPGEKLQLNSDIQLEFESRKTADGKIDPDYCRIIFILDLTHLRETMVDMQIQNRIVSLTIFNDHQTVKDLYKVWQPWLKERLEKLHYQLSNVNVKPLRDQDKTASQSQTKLSTNAISHEGVDYRI